MASAIRLNSEWVSVSIRGSRVGDPFHIQVFTRSEKDALPTIPSLMISSKGTEEAIELIQSEEKGAGLPTGTYQRNCHIYWRKKVSNVNSVLEVETFQTYFKRSKPQSWNN